MKKILFLMIAAGCSLPAVAQRAKFNADSLLSRWVIDVNLLGGMSTQNFTTPNSAPNYLNALNADQGNLKFKDGFAYGADLQLGLFFGKKKHWGLGTGFMYLQQNGFANLDNYHIEYQATDFQGSTYRQLITGNNVSETVKMTNLNIPVLLKYKNRFSKRWGFTADGGALINLKTTNSYNTHASFDYEAIYQFQAKEGGGNTTVYDNSPTPNPNDWMITKAEFLQNNPNGNMNAYFNAKRALGFNVGLNEPVNNNSGKVSYTTGTIGYMIQPSFNYFLSDHVALNFGGYYLIQPIKNTVPAAYKLNDGTGNYSSVLNNVTASTNQSYGLNLGVRFFLGGKKHPPVAISSIDQNSPTQCGLCDGSIQLNGLAPNQAVTVDYSFNGNKQPQYTTTTQADGKVKIPNLCPGSYTDIMANVDRRSSNRQGIVVTEAIMSISAQTTVNPTATGLSDGSVKFYGFYSGRSVTINYNLNGAPQPPFTGIVATDNSISINGLGEGSYTNVAATVGTCSAKGSDFTLKAPVTTPPQTSKTTTVSVDISTPILFDVNQIVIHSDAYPVLDEAVKELNENSNTYVYVKGNADTTGPEAHNRTLSIERANAVKDALVQKGIDPKRVKTEGDGSRNPAETNDTIEGRQENRRAVIKLKKY